MVPPPVFFSVFYKGEGYDVPLAKASEKGYYTEMLTILRMLLQVIKDNSSLKFAVITGCLRLAKESIFTGTNNLVSDTISDNRLNSYFGFTQMEVEQLLTKTKLSSHLAEIKEWYDGYLFEDCEIYCPWDVMNHVKNSMLKENTPPSGYWKNSSDNAIIHSFLDYAGHSINKKLETLLPGDFIIQKLEEDLTYHYLHSSEENLWSILYLTGYLTKAKQTNPPQILPKGYTALTIPNKEIKEIYEDTIVGWFQETTQRTDRTTLFHAIWNQNCEKITIELTKLLRKTISYYNYKEDFYHAFLAGIFAGAGYVVESNREHEEGRSDITLEDYAGEQIAVFEFKHSKSFDFLSADCDAALSQIEQRMYDKDLREEYAEVICYGVAFFKKRCFVKKA